MARPLAILLVLGAGACGTAEPTPAPVPRPPTDDPAAARSPELLSLHREADRLLDGGAPAFRERLRSLRGHPVVVNKWASWCPPCRAEFPFMRNQAAMRRGRVAFLGVDSQDADEDALAFLRRSPLGYPSYRDPKLEVAQVFNGVGGFPSTAFYDARGRLAYLKQGGYATERALADDIERYALR